MKAITPVIGIIILLLIAVSLAGTAYSFLSGLFGSYSDKTIKIVPYSEDEYKVTIQNLGTTAFNTSEIIISVDGDQAQLFNPQIVQSKQAATLEFFPPSIGDNKQIRLAGPTNTENYVTDLNFFPLFSCSQTDPPGFWKNDSTYKLVNDVTTFTVCYTIDGARDIILDCDGKKILSTAFGISFSAKNGTIQNCVIEALDRGIIINSNSTTIKDNSINISETLASGSIIISGVVWDTTLINNNVCPGLNSSITIDSADPQNANSRDNGCDAGECFHGGGATSSNICDTVPNGNCDLQC